jgi:hypothetical protein
MLNPVSGTGAVLLGKYPANSPEVFVLEAPSYPDSRADRLSVFVIPRIEDVAVLRRSTTEVEPLPTPHILSLSYALAIWARLIQPSFSCTRCNDQGSVALHHHAMERESGCQEARVKRQIAKLHHIDGYLRSRRLPGRRQTLC